MWPIAFVGFRPLGQTDTQFIIPLQRNNENGSSRRDKRSWVAVSRESIIKRYAFNNADGPKNLSGFHQNDGHDVEQHAQRIHSYKPSKCSRSSGDCKRSLGGAGWLLIRNGWI